MVLNGNIDDPESKPKKVKVGLRKVASVFRWLAKKMRWKSKPKLPALPSPPSQAATNCTLQLFLTPHNLNTGETNIKLRSLASYQEQQLAEGLSKGIVQHGQVEHRGEWNENFEKTLDNYIRKYDRCMLEISQLEATVAHLHDQLTNSWGNEHDKDVVLEELRAQLKTIAQELEEKKVNLNRTEIIIGQLTTQLTQEDLQTAFEKIQEHEISIGALHEKLNDAQQEVTCELECSKMSSDLKIYCGGDQLEMFAREFAKFQEEGNLNADDLFQIPQTLFGLPKPLTGANPGSTSSIRQLQLPESIRDVAEVESSHSFVPDVEFNLHDIDHGNLVYDPSKIRLTEENKMLESSLDNYKERYDMCINQVTQLESTITILQKQISDRANKVKMSNISSQTTSNQVLPRAHRIHTDLVLQDELESVSEKNKRLEETLSTYKYKYDKCMDQIIHMEATFTVLEEKLKHSKNDERDKDEILEQLRSRLVAILHELDDKTSTLCHTEIVIEQLRKELTQDDLTKAYNKIEQHELSITEFNTQLAAAQQEILNNEERASKFQNDLTIYKQSHAYTNEEFSEREKCIRQLEFDYEDLQGQLLWRTHQVAALQDNVDEMRTEITSLRDSKVTTQRQWDRIMAESGEEICSLREALDHARSNGERMHQESEIGLQKVNMWVKEQKQANDMLGKKIICLQEEVLVLQRTNFRLTSEMVNTPVHTENLMSEQGTKMYKYRLAVRSLIDLRFQTLQNLDLLKFQKFTVKDKPVTKEYKELTHIENDVERAAKVEGLPEEMIPVQNVSETTLPNIKVV